MRYRKTSANTRFAICARDIPYPRTGPFGPNWPDDADTHKGPGAEQMAHAARHEHGDSCAHPQARVRAQLPCPLQLGARARPPNPLSLRADDHDDVETCLSSIESATSSRTMVGTSMSSLRRTHDGEEPLQNPARARQIFGRDLRIWGVYAPFLSSLVTFESMVTAARRIVLPHQLWEVQRDCLQSARLAYSNPPGSCSPPRQADDLCAGLTRRSCGTSKLMRKSCTQFQGSPTAEEALALLAACCPCD